jgi:peroxiredoxin
MGLRRLFVLLLVVSTFAPAAGDTVDQAAARVERFASQSTPALRPEFRILAAQALKDRYPKLADKFVHAVLADVRSRDEIDFRLLDGLATLAPDETIALLPHLKPGSDLMMADAMMRSNQVRPAVALYRASFKKGLQRTDIAPLFKRLAKDSPDDAKTLFADFLAAFSFQAATPLDLYGLTNCADAMSMLAPKEAADVFARVLTIVSAPDYGKTAKLPLTANFQIGSTKITATNSRDTLLLAAGARLHALAPARLEKFKNALTPWNLTGAFTVQGVTYTTPPVATATPPAEPAISERMKKLRGLPDAERAKVVLELAHAIRDLPKGSKLDLAETLASYATEGDNGREALDAVAATLGQSMQEVAATAAAYIELAGLVRYEHVRAPFASSSLDAADAILALRDRLRQEASFMLTSMDGKTYSLASLRGKIVLLNFWATWCLPCRMEMPDIETLHRRFEKKGLVILAVSFEDRETVAGFLEKQHYTFPVLLDPEHKATDAFVIDNFPSSFVFNRDGKLVAQVVDMRTERQFLDMLREAGLQ